MKKVIILVATILLLGCSQKKEKTNLICGQVLEREILTYASDTRYVIIWIDHTEWLQHMYNTSDPKEYLHFEPGTYICKEIE